MPERAEQGYHGQEQLEKQRRSESITKMERKKVGNKITIRT